MRSAGVYMRITLILIVVAVLQGATPACWATVRYVVLAPPDVATTVRDAATTVPKVPIEARVVAKRLDRPAEIIDQRNAVPSEGTLPLEEGTWEIEVKADSIWSPRVYVSVSSDSAAATIPTYLSSTLKFDIGVSKPDIELPAEVRVMLMPPRASNQTAAVEPLHILCPITSRQAECVAPSGTYDVRYSAPGFAPGFVSDAALKANARVVLPPFMLVRGAAVVGRVVYRHDDGAPATDVRDAVVTLTPVGAERTRTAPLRARPDAGGIFVIGGVPPGEYHAQAISKQRSSDTATVRVLPELTAELSEPLELARPRAIRVIISPPLDPDGQRWNVSLLRARRDGRSVENYASGSAAADGEWRQEVRSGGAYTLTVSRIGGGRWARADIEVQRTDVFVPLYAPPTKIRGTIRFGEQLIAAKLHFGGEMGAIREVVQTRDDGTFEAHVPSVDGDTWDVLVEADVPPVSRTLRRVKGRRTDDSLIFDLVLPRTAITGVVVNADGTPEKHALVNLTGTMRTTAGLDFDQSAASTDGSFQLSGMAPGTYSLSAESFLKESEAVAVEVTEAAHPNVTLVVKAVPQMQGRVVFRGTAPVVGARIEAIRRNGAPAGATATSNESGIFVLFLPVDTTIVDVLVVPPGFAVLMARVPAYQNRELLVDVEPYSGVLTLKVPRASHPMLRHAGADLPLALLTETVPGARSSEEADKRVVSLPAMERGEYTLCVGTSNCKSGYLAPNGALELSVK